MACERNHLLYFKWLTLRRRRAVKHVVIWNLISDWEIAAPQTAAS
jgi:hypothetical protein